MRGGPEVAAATDLPEADEEERAERERGEVGAKQEPVDPVDGTRDPCAVVARQVAQQHGQLVAVARAVRAPEPLLELVDVEPARRGVVAQGPRAAFPLDV